VTGPVQVGRVADEQMTEPDQTAVRVARDLGERYLAGRPDGLRVSTGEDFLVATV
jgi:hypothetical protein